MLVPSKIIAPFGCKTMRTFPNDSTSVLLELRINVAGVSRVMPVLELIVVFLEDWMSIYLPGIDV